MRILLTGAGGFVGRHLVGWLQKHFGPGCDLLALEARPGARPGQETGSIKSIAVDVRDFAKVSTTVQRFKPTLTVNLAAISSVSEALADADTTYDVNVIGTLNLARAVAAVSPGSLFIQASTVDVYGRAFLGESVVSEASPVAPQNPYARTKLAAEFVLEDAVSATCRVVALRVANHIGPGQDERFAVASFAAQIARIEAGQVPPILKTGNLSVSRNFLDVRDVLRAYLAILQSEQPQTGFSVYNVASGQSRTLASIVESLLRLSDAEIRIEQDSTRFRPNDIPVALLSAESFRAATGWTPEVPFDQTLASILADWRRRVAGGK